ncbi:MAG TPA: hypothetical protein VGG89_15365 [Candidatus Baltobacteraceae bacterium]|jgi:hypothetical protein
MRSLRVYAFVAASALSACRGGGALPQIPAPAFPATTSDVTPAGATAGGVVNTKNWSVATGKTVKVTKNLAVFASASITISGTLVVPRGIQVAFFTPSFTIVGPYGGIETTKNGKYAGPVDDFVSACHIDLQSKWEIASGDNAGITSSTKQNANPKQPCIARFGVGIAFDDGAKGGTDKNRPNGQNGGSIVIGTSDAVSRTQALAKKDGHKTVKAYPPDVVEIESPILSGNGGDGKDDNAGTATADGYTFTGSNGGHAGSIEITTSKITGSSPNLMAGHGGKGGTLAASFWSGIGYSSSNGYPLNGTPTHPNGYDITFVQGAGGGGGSIFIKAKSWPKSSMWQPGSGGSVSAFSGAEIGSGYYGACQNCILAGFGLHGLGAAPGSGVSNGGSAEIDFAQIGKKGTGDRNDAHSRPVNGSYAAYRVEGGWGGNWSQGDLNTGVAGGNGGDLTLVPPKHIAIASLKQFGLSITIDQFGNGGPGTYWCPDTPPATGAGYKGGNGGRLYENGLIDYISIITYGSSTSSKDLSKSFNGGNGSDGNPPAAGGSGGSSDEGAVGQDGKTGNPC